MEENLQPTFNEEYSSQEYDEMLLSQPSQLYLYSSAKWMTFLSIIGFIGLGLLFLFSILALVSASAVPQYQASIMKLIGIAFIVLVLIYIYPVILFFRATQNIKNGIAFQNKQMIEDGFEEQRRMFKWMVIINAISIACSILLNLNNLF